ncbi:CCA tRNA nucleotidyltransferase [uncultured Hyphomonas sp.]|uniref:CCA tRNA nucleotidyltransferase n=1 Tax=uncultured Hyphomonas sp. TaxID=225298 RepID=UPI002AAAD666|nr:CCA tRNA nucleotidyltransferase [uncultured Hyphomonas sp.]
MAQTEQVPDRIEAGWLNAPGTRAVMAALEAARPGGARFVGGCVRNTLRGIPADDIDIATQIPPEDTMKAMKAAGIRALPTGIEHGTVTAIIDGEPFEITSLRRDVETDGRRAVVAFTEDWAEDAERRDFRLNAIYAGPDGTLHEVVPGSIGDALAGRVIFIGDGDQRLKEDYLRILRFFRFNAWYGAEVDAEGLAACTRQKDGLAKIARERIWKELKRLLEAPDPSDAMLAMEESGVLEAVLPGANAGVLPALVSVEQAESLSPDPIQRLMALLPRRLRDARAVGRALRLSNAEQNRLIAWADPALGHVEMLSPAKLAEAFYRYGKEVVCDRALIEAAGGAGDSLKRVLAAAARWSRPELPVGGADALAAGLSGPAVGKALASAEEAWIASGFKLSRESLLARLTPSD